MKCNITTVSFTKPENLPVCILSLKKDGNIYLQITAKSPFSKFQQDSGYHFHFQIPLTF